jgi:hypothetical protein
MTAIQRRMKIASTTRISTVVTASSRISSYHLQPVLTVAGVVTYRLILSPAAAWITRRRFRAARSFAAVSPGAVAARERIVAVSRPALMLTACMRDE